MYIVHNDPSQQHWPPTLVLGRLRQEPAVHTTLNIGCHVCHGQGPKHRRQQQQQRLTNKRHGDWQNGLYGWSVSKYYSHSALLTLCRSRVTNTRNNHKNHAGYNSLLETRNLKVFL